MNTIDVVDTVKQSLAQAGMVETRSGSRDSFYILDQRGQRYRVRVEPVGQPRARLFMPVDAQVD